MSQVPNVEGTANANVLTGGQFGAIVGASVTETVGHYGLPGVAHQTGVAVTAAAIHAACVALGLFAA